MSKTYRIGDNEWVGMRHGFMAFIHAVNGVCDERGIERIFGAPDSLGDWWVPGLYCEEYPDARVIYSKGSHAERVERGEGYRMVLKTEDVTEEGRVELLESIWDEAWARVEPQLETKHDMPKVTKVSL